MLLLFECYIAYGDIWTPKWDRRSLFRFERRPSREEQWHKPGVSNIVGLGTKTAAHRRVITLHVLLSPQAGSRGQMKATTSVCAER